MFVKYKPSINGPVLIFFWEKHVRDDPHALGHNPPIMPPLHMRAPSSSQWAPTHPSEPTMNGPFRKAFPGCRASSPGHHFALYTSLCSSLHTRLSPPACLRGSCSLWGLGWVHPPSVPHSALGWFPGGLAQEGTGVRPPDRRRVREE